jgi:sigma-E factor negative regulatory protein RseC
MIDDAEHQQPAQVMRLDAETVWLSAMPKQHCASCAMKPGCGQTWRMSSYLGLEPSSWLSLNRRQISHLPNLAVGDQVWVALPKGAILAGSLQLYGVPVLTVLVASALASGLGLSDLAVAGVVLGLFTLSLVAMKRWRAQQDASMALRVSARMSGQELIHSQ